MSQLSFRHRQECQDVVFELRSGHWGTVHASLVREVLSFVVWVQRARSPPHVRLFWGRVSTKEDQNLGERGKYGGIGLGLGVIPWKWVCPNCLGSARVLIARRGMVGRGRGSRTTPSVYHWTWKDWKGST